jgi:hypothetical protein
MKYSDDLIQKVVKLRKKGLSYREIEKTHHISKDTIRRWCKSVILNPQQIKHLNEKQELGRQKAVIQAVQSKKRKVIQAQQLATSIGVSQIGPLSEREEFLIGVSLYFAEGSKTGSGVEFTNSDPESVKFMVNWFQKYCEVDKQKIKFSLWLHENLDETKSIIYWSQLLQVAPKQFGKTFFAKNKIESKKGRKNIHIYGIIKARFYSVEKLRLIKGWIKGIFTP